MLKRYLKRLPQRIKPSFPKLQTRNLRRTFSEKQDQEFDVEDLFRDEEAENTFNDPQIYFINRNIEKLKRHANTGFSVAGVNFLFSAGLFYFNHPYIGAGVLIFSVVPYIRSKMIKKNLKKVITMIEINEEQDQIVLVYGIDRIRVKANIEDIKTMRVSDMMDEKNKGGFIVSVNVVDDLGELHDGLQVYVHQQKTDIVNMKLLTKVLSGDVDSVKEFKFVEPDEED